MKVFVSTCDTDDLRVAEIIDRLRQSPDVEVEHSPLNPAVGDDPRWRGWYAGTCDEAIGRADCFLVIETAGYDGSTWMQHEFLAALKLHQVHRMPSLFLSRCVADGKLPVGFEPCEKAATILPVEPTAVVAAFLIRAGAGDTERQD